MREIGKGRPGRGRSRFLSCCCRYFLFLFFSNGLDGSCMAGYYWLLYVRHLTRYDLFFLLRFGSSSRFDFVTA